MKDRCFFQHQSILPFYTDIHNLCCRWVYSNKLLCHKFYHHEKNSENPTKVSIYPGETEYWKRLLIFFLKSLKGMLKRIKIVVKSSMKKRTGEFEKEQNGMLEIRSMVIVILKHWLDRLLLELRKKNVN